MSAANKTRPTVASPAIPVSTANPEGATQDSQGRSPWIPVRPLEGALKGRPIVLCLLLCGVAAAQDLRAALEEAKRELAAEEARIQKEDAAGDAAVAEAKAALGRLTDEIADRTRALAAKTRELDAARANLNALREARAASLGVWTALHRTAVDAQTRLADLVGALPPSERRDAQRADLDAARKALEVPAGTPFDLAPLLRAADSLLDEAHTAARFAHELRNADGVVEKLDILRAGMIFHAYRSPSGRIGEVFAPPGGGAGYRWSESLPDEARDRIARAFAGGTVGDELPIDVTQRMAPDRRSGRGWFETFRAGGIVMIPLSLLALLSAIVIVERLVTLHLRCGSPEEIVRGVLEAARSGDLDEAARRAEGGRGTTLRALAAALRERGAGRARMEEAVQEAVLHEMPMLERFLPLLAVFAGISPMLGLLGTVTGMISTFDMIRLFGSGDPRIMAGGISEALIATAAGLMVAIPLLLFHSWCSGRVDRILADAQRHSTTVVNIACESQEPARVA